jgi:hypothetical protein
MDDKTKQKVEQAVDKMQGLKTFRVIEIKTVATEFIVKAPDREEAIEAVCGGSPEIEQCRHEDITVEYKVEEEWNGN